MNHPLQTHQECHDRFAEEANRLERSFVRFGWPRFALFLIASVCLIAWWSNRTPVYLWGAILSTTAFILLGVWMLKLRTRLDLAEQRKGIHTRHLMRMQGRFQELPAYGADLVPKDHNYAWDLDLVGPGSLFQRMDTTHTVQGAERLIGWLCHHAPKTTIEERQSAIQELRDCLEFRQELECAAIGKDMRRLDVTPFLTYLKTSPTTTERFLNPILTLALPAVTCSGIALSILHYIPASLWLLPFGIQLAVWLRFQNRASDALDWLTARFDFADVFSKMFQLTADANFSAPYLKAQHAEAQAALQGLHKLRRLVRIAELRQQGLLHALINPLFLWDLNCALRLNAWKQHYAHQAPAWFETTATLEALCALGSYAFTEPHATFPTIEEEEGTWQAHALGHPLLAPDIRVSNDVSLLGPKSLMIITGSNMAGKSTLLRAVGVNTALALAGGPVCASHMRLSLCRLRASMRIQDSLQTGASYFHAELQRLDATLENAAQKPPVFFLLDELLRGTNAQARHEASRAVLIHLLERGAFGIIATHDTELTELAKEQPGHIVNVHFTDVMVGQEMHFDYMLRQGPVRSSNAVPLVTRLLMRHA